MAPSRKPKLQVGDVVAGRYRIDGVVGKGGFGAVYRASQLETGQAVALKILLKNYGAAKTDSKRFRREAALVQKLRHPKIVELIDFGYTERGQPFIAFELLTGEAMSRIIKTQGPLDDGRAAAVTADVLDALQAAHAFGVIHRDIKPGNIFVLDGGGSKVLDFGIAKAVSGEEAGGTQLTEAGQMIGTPHYMAPEQVRGTGVVPATDLYSLGLVMAELVSGKRAIRGNALIDVYMAHISDGPLPFDASVRSSPLWPVIERATQKLLSDRYGDAAAMAAHLAEVRAKLPSDGVVALMAAPASPSSGTPNSSIEPPSSCPTSSVEPPASTANGTLLMEGAEANEEGRKIIEAVRRAVADDEAKTLNMSDGQLRKALDAEIKALTPVPGSVHPPSGVTPASTAELPVPSGASMASSSSAAFSSSSPPSAHVSPPHVSGVMHSGGAPISPPATAAKSGPKTHQGSGLALFLIAVAVVALAAAALLLVGPWSG